jgi:hypothetical protein
MPVTVRFSSKFYERLGDDVAGELVDWCNTVDETYRNQLKEMNESFWERLSAHLDASLGVTRNDVSAMRGDLKNETVKMGADLRTEMSGTRADLRTEIGNLGAQLRTEMANMRADLIKWMFVFWIGNVVSLGGLMVGLRFLGK